MHIAQLPHIFSAVIRRDFFYCRLGFTFFVLSLLILRKNLSRSFNFSVFNLEIRLRNSKLSTFCQLACSLSLWRWHFFLFQMLPTIDDAPNTTEKFYSQISECLDIPVSLWLDYSSTTKRRLNVFPYVVLFFKSKAQDTSRDSPFFLLLLHRIQLKNSPCMMVAGRCMWTMLKLEWEAQRVIR
jgi:hypothetical protein